MDLVVAVVVVVFALSNEKQPEQEQPCLPDTWRSGAELLDSFFFFFKLLVTNGLYFLEEKQEAAAAKEQDIQKHLDGGTDNTREIRLYFFQSRLKKKIFFTSYLVFASSSFPSNLFSGLFANTWIKRHRFGYWVGPRLRIPSRKPRQTWQLFGAALLCHWGKKNKIKCSTNGVVQHLRSPCPPSYHVLANSGWCQQLICPIFFFPTTSAICLSEALNLDFRGEANTW